MDNEGLFTQELENYINEMKKDEKKRSLLFWFFVIMLTLLLGTVATYFVPKNNAITELAWFAMENLS